MNNFASTTGRIQLQQGQFDFTNPQDPPFIEFDLVGDAGGRSFFALAPNLAVTAAHNLFDFDISSTRLSIINDLSLDNQVREENGFANSSFRDASFLRGYDTRAVQRAEQNLGLTFDDASRDIATFVTNVAFNTSQLTGLAVFLNPTQLEGQPITALGFPDDVGNTFTTVSGNGSSLINDRVLISTDLGISTGFSGGPTFTSTSNLTGTDDQFAIGVNSQFIPGSTESVISLFTESDIRFFAEIVADSGIDTDELPRYLFVGSSDPAVEIEDISGTRLRDVIVGGNANESLFGRDASDELLGGSGNDTLIGDGALDSPDVAGDDTLDGGDGFDIVDYLDAAGSACLCPL